MILELFDSNSLNFVKLNATGDNDAYIRCDSESKFLSTSLFNLFIDCFENSNKLYEYFEPTKYNSRNIIPLLNEFLRKRSELEAYDSADSFLDYIKELAFGEDFLNKQPYRNIESEWIELRDKLVQVTDDIIAYINVIIEEDAVLWIIGY